MKSAAYLAGLFDGEGSFSIQVGVRRRDCQNIHISPSMSVNLYYGTEVLRHFVSEFGGKIYPYQRDGVLRGARWHLGRREPVLRAARILVPILEIKRNIGERFIKALEMFPTQARIGDRVWTVENAVQVAEIALTLNPPRSRKSNKTLEYLETLKMQLRPATE